MSGDPEREGLSLHFAREKRKREGIFLISPFPSPFEGGKRGRFASSNRSGEKGGERNSFYPLAQKGGGKERRGQSIRGGNLYPLS